MFTLRKATTPMAAVCWSNQAFEYGRQIVSLEQAKQLMLEGHVQTIYQPHIGLVRLTLRSGETLTFAQPFLDWVLGFVTDNGLEGVLLQTE